MKKIKIKIKGQGDIHTSNYNKLKILIKKESKERKK